MSLTQLISINNSCAISLITIIPKSKTVLFLLGTTNTELENQPSMDHVDYYTDDQQSTHDVTPTIPFEIGQYEITNDQFCKVMNRAIKRDYVKIINGDLKSTNDILYLGITHLDGDVTYLKIKFGIEIICST